MSAKLEIAATSVVLRGSFNPPIFHPRWFESHELLGEEHARAAEDTVKALDTELMAFTVEWLEVQVTRELCQFVTNDSARHADLRDLVLGTFTHLGNTPLAAVGLNRLVHYQFTDADVYQRILELYLPNGAFVDFLQTPTTTVIQVRADREGPKPGYTNVRVEPSVRVKPLGLFIATNDDYEWSAEGAMGLSDDVPLVLESEWEVARERANDIVSHILNS